MEFTSWENEWDGAPEEYLEHHGIPGMKWGVRRYQNKDGTLTAAGEGRYGSSSKGRGISARKLTRDFNNLDRGYANVVAEQRQAAKHRNKVANKMVKRAARLSNGDPAKAKEVMGSDRKIQKQMAKMKKDTAKINMTEQQKKNIENLQMRIIGKAASQGYTTRSKAVVRLGNTQKQRAAAIIAGTLAGGGALTGAAIGEIMSSRASRVDGQKVKITKRGDGTTSLVNYHNVNQQERRRTKRG